MYSSKIVAKLFNVSVESIRLWTQEFNSYLSPTAKPGAGRHRRYTDDDLQVLALIAAMRDAGQLYEDIHLALRSGQRLQPPSPDEEAALQPAYTERLKAERNNLLQQLTEAEARYARLEGRLEQTTLEKEALRLELAVLREEATRLNRENAILNYRLEQAQDD